MSKSASSGEGDGEEVIAGLRGEDDLLAIGYEDDGDLGEDRTTMYEQRTTDFYYRGEGMVTREELIEK